MTTQRNKTRWLDPSKEGKSRGRLGKRYCSRCGNTVQRFRILRGLNLCEMCVKELESRKDGVHSCRACGKFAPKEVKEHKGYCKDCICPACGRPDPDNIKRIGMCQQCASGIDDFCIRCGKEAAAQVRKNKGLCNACAGTLNKKP